MLVQVREFYREPEILFWGLGFPIVMAWVLGIAFSGDRQSTRNIAWVIPGKHAKVENNQSFILSRFGADSSFGLKTDPVSGAVTFTLGNKNEGMTTYRLLPAEQAAAELLVRKGVAPLILLDNRDSLVYRFDPKNSEAYLAYLQIAGAVQQVKAGVQHGAEVEKLSAQGMRYIDFFVPGLLSMNMMFGIMWGVSYSLIEKRSKKLLRRMVATPMSKSMFLASFILGRLALGLFEAYVLIFFSRLYFGLQIQGSLAAFFLIYIAGTICFSGMAIVMSSRSAKPQTGNALINLVTMPMMICSGVFFSYHSFPEAVIPIIQKFPLTIMVDNVRSVFNEGAGVLDVIPGTILLTVAGIVLFTVGLKVYKWY